MQPRPAAFRAIALLVGAALLTCAAWSKADTPAPQASGAAAAPSQTLDAADLRRQGNEAMAAFKPGEALEAYRRAYELTRDPALLYNMGRALEALEDYPAALGRYEEFARLASADLRARVPKLDETMAALRSRITKLSIVCNVPGARVLVRDKAVGDTLSHGEPLVVSLTAGSATLEVDADGYGTFQRSIVLPGGSTLGVNVDLVSNARAGLLLVDSQPAGSDVLIDGRPLGNAPVEASVGAGTHEVVVRHAGFQDSSTSVVVGLGERRSVTITLRRPTPVTQKWWFWAGVGAVVVAGAIVTYAELTARPADTGSIQPGQTQAPLGR